MEDDMEEKLQLVNIHLLARQSKAPAAICASDFNASQNPAQDSPTIVFFYERMPATEAGRWAKIGTMNELPDRKSLKILLVLPAGENVRVTPERPAVPRRAMLRFSVLPLTVVAALTPPGHQVRIIDENVEPLDFEAECDVVGITCMTALAPRACQIADRFRQRGKIVVAGGYHPTLMPEDCAPHFDALVIGDAEGLWQEFLGDAQNGTVKKVYRRAGLPGPVLEAPAPRRELLRDHARHYATINAVQAGRGCRHNCRYCSVTIFHAHSYRHRAVAEVMAELRGLAGDFIFVDDNIIADRAYALELFKAMVPLRKHWVSQCSALIADDPALLEGARAAGCCGLFIGLETANQGNLAQMNKNFNQAESYRARLGRIHRAGIGVVAGMIVGMDGDETTVFQETLRFLRETEVDAVQLNILTPLPGTPLHEEMQAAGRVTDRDWSRYDYRHVVFRPARMSAEELQAGADWVYAQFYRLDQIVARFARALWRVGWRPAWLGLKLGLTYRHDNRREGIHGRNPAEARGRTRAGWVERPDWAHITFQLFPITAIPQKMQKSVGLTI
jgi:radical SAM superfamily enzyme YgiQ (UPF0313 family)